MSVKDVKLHKAFKNASSKLREKSDLKTVEKIRELKEQIIELFRKEKEMLDSLNANKDDDSFSEDIISLKDDIKKLSDRKIEIPDFHSQIVKSETELKGLIKVLEGKGEQAIKAEVGEFQKKITSIEDDLKKFRKDTLNSLSRGGTAPSQINVNSSVMSFRYADINFQQAGGIGWSAANDDFNKRVNITASILSGSPEGASKALDNLANVAINTSLISDTDSTDDLGSSSKFWANNFVDKISLSTTWNIEGIAPSTPLSDATLGGAFIKGRLAIDAGNEVANQDGFSLYGDWRGLIGYAMAVYDTSDVNNPQRVFYLQRSNSSNGMIIKVASISFEQNVANSWIPQDSTYDLGSSTKFWDETFTDELVLQQGTMGATAVDQVRLAGLDLSPGDSGLHIKTENDTEHLFASKVGIGNVSPQELLHVGTGTDGSDITATDLLITRAGPSNLSVRDSTNNVETFLFASSVGGIMGTVTNDPLNIQTNNASAIFIDASQNVGIGTATPNETLTIEAGVLSIKETTTPTATTNYGKIYTKNNNELFFQDGAGTEHLLHGDAFSEIWFHGVSTVEVTISTQNALTKIESFTVVGNEDDLLNIVGSISTNDLTLSSIAGGEYEISFHASITATGGADKEMLICLGITLATPKDITDVTDDLVTPIVVTSTAHGLEDGDMVEIAGVLGNTAANGSFIVDNKTANTFEIVDLSGGATTGNGNFDAGSPTGDVTIEYPGNMVVHREVRGATLGAVSATGLHILADSDVLGVYVANLDGITNLTVAAISFDCFRIGD